MATLIKSILGEIAKSYWKDLEIKVKAILYSTTDEESSMIEISNKALHEIVMTYDASKMLKFRQNPTITMASVVANVDLKTYNSRVLLALGSGPNSIEFIYYPQRNKRISISSIITKNTTTSVGLCAKYSYRQILEALGTFSYDITTKKKILNTSIELILPMMKASILIGNDKLAATYTGEITSTTKVAARAQYNLTNNKTKLKIGLKKKDEKLNIEANINNSGVVEGELSTSYKGCIYKLG